MGFRIWMGLDSLTLLLFFGVSIRISKSSARVGRLLRGNHWHFCNAWFVLFFEGKNCKSMEVLCGKQRVMFIRGRYYSPLYCRLDGRSLFLLRGGGEDLNVKILRERMDQTDTAIVS